MKVEICRKCNKNKACRLKDKLFKQLKKKERDDVYVKMTGCLGGCKGLTVKISKQKCLSGLKVKDAKKIADLIA